MSTCHRSPLRAENDEAETKQDLEHWGYDPKTLELVAKPEGVEKAAEPSTS